MRTPKVLSIIFANMPTISKWQCRFITVLMTTVFALRGRLTFTNMARFSPLHEQTFRRNFQRAFDWTRFNLAVLALAYPDQSRQLIGVLDCTFIGKSGTETYGLDRFWSSSDSTAKRGLELSVLALIETESRERFTLDAAQTPPDLAQGDQVGSYSRIDFYMEQFIDCAASLAEVKYFKSNTSLQTAITPKRRSSRPLPERSES